MTSSLLVEKPPYKRSQSGTSWTLLTDAQELQDPEIRAAQQHLPQPPEGHPSSLQSFRCEDASAKKATRKNADKYSRDSIQKIVEAADTDEKDLILFYLYAGFRDEEAVYSKYSDIDFKKGTINVHD